MKNPHKNTDLKFIQTPPFRKDRDNKGVGFWVSLNNLESRNPERKLQKTYTKLGNNNSEWIVWYKDYSSPSLLLLHIYGQVDGQ